jgi:hypothetical protein
LRVDRNPRLATPTLFRDGPRVTQHPHPAVLRFTSAWMREFLGQIKDR